ncbi:MAG: class I SAM-dependent methyltransferase [Pseudomonadota bacterium]
MSEQGFTPSWLDLREPADHAARDKELLRLATNHVGPGRVILDLGSGTGSTARAFSDLLPDRAWRFVDGDERLLAEAGARHPESERVLANLRELGSLPWSDVGLVTASALLDLMPSNWVLELAGRVSEVGAPFYAALNYNGSMQWSPSVEGDKQITSFFNQHQQTDKGLGPALGPYASETAVDFFERHGFELHVGDSPWSLTPHDEALQGELIDGIASAANDAGYNTPQDWLNSRRQVLGKTSLLVGHTDILALPAPRN